jgi:hypothetical protein
VNGVLSRQGNAAPPGRFSCSVQVALGGEKERAELAAFEALLVKWIADAKNRVPYSAD